MAMPRFTYTPSAHSPATPFTSRSRLSMSFPGLFIVVQSRQPHCHPERGFCFANAKQNRSRRTPALLNSRLKLQGILPLAFPYRSPLNPPLVQLPLKNPFHINRRRMNLISIQLPSIHHVFHLGNRNLRRRCHHGIKIPRRLAINQIPFTIALPRLHKSEVSLEPPLHHVRPPIKFASLFSLGGHSPHARRRIKRRY